MPFVLNPNAKVFIPSLSTNNLSTSTERDTQNINTKHEYYQMAHYMPKKHIIDKGLSIIYSLKLNKYTFEYMFKFTIKMKYIIININARKLVKKPKKILLNITNFEHSSILRIVKRRSSDVEAELHADIPQILNYYIPKSSKLISMKPFKFQEIYKYKRILSMSRQCLPKYNITFPIFIRISSFSIFIKSGINTNDIIDLKQYCYKSIKAITLPNYGLKTSLLSYVLEENRHKYYQGFYWLYIV